MNMLDFTDQHWVRKLTEAFSWGGMSLQADEQKIIAKANHFLAGIPHEDIRQWLRWRMDTRTIVAALRRRRQGEDAPAAGVNWGYGSYVRHIRQHWSNPTFNLEHRFHWLPTVADELAKGESFAVEKALLSGVWHYYNSQHPSTPFGFSAVVLYVIKWDLVDRWCQNNADRARVNFDKLVNTTLAQSLKTLKDMA
jgi:truncated hemoglobin YjbI